MFTAHALIAVCLLAGGLLSPVSAAADTVPGYGCVDEVPYPDSTPPYQPLRVCASFDKASYSSGDVVKLTVSATNIGTATAPGVTMWQLSTSGSDGWISNPVGPLITDGTGEDLPAGATVVSEVDGYAESPASGAVTFSGSVYEFLPDGTGNAFGDPVSISSAVTPATGDYSGTVFVDGDGSGRPSPGARLAGTQVTLTGPFNGIDGNPTQTYSATSDAQGDFHLSDLPAGHYYVSATGPDGWFVRPGTDGRATIDATSGRDPALFPATPDPLPLRASATLDKTSYRAGDTAQVTINLTNTSGTDLHGIQADCDPGGAGDSMAGRGAGWDVLEAPGMTVPAGGTSTLHLSEVVPALAEGGVTATVYLDCVFSPNPGYEFGGVPQIDLSAKVTAPANPISFTLQAVDDDPLGGAATARFDLLDPASQDPLVDPFGTPGPVSDLPAGTYDLAISAWSTGWTPAPGQSGVLDTADITDGQTVDIHVVPTQQVPPPSPPGD